MRIIRLFILALASFLTVTCGSFLQRAIAFSLCGILGINSPACYLLGNRVNAAVPIASSEATMIAQNIDIFSPDGGGSSPPPPTDIFSPPNPQNPPPSGGDDIFAPPNSTSPQVDRPNNGSQNNNTGDQSKQNCDYPQAVYTVYVNGVRTPLQNYINDETLISNLLSKANVPAPFLRQITYNYGDNGEQGRRETGLGDLWESFWQSVTDGYTFKSDASTLVNETIKQIKEFEERYKSLNAKSSCDCKIPRPKYLLIGYSQGNFFIEDIANGLPEEIAQRTGILAISPFTDYSNTRVKQLNYLLRSDDIPAVGAGVLPNIKIPGSPNLPPFPTLLSYGDLYDKIPKEIADILKKLGVSPQQALDSHALTNYLGVLATQGKLDSRDQEIYANVVQRAADMAVANTRNLIASIEDSYYEKDQEDCSTTAAKLPTGQLTKGTSYGDPHMITFDGFKYSFQTVGEFTLVKSTNGNFEVQARQGSISNSVSMNTAVAMKIGNSRVALYAKNLPDSDTSTPLRVDGKPTKLENGTLELPGGGTIQGNSSYYLITAPTGEQIGVSIGNQRMDITPYISGESGQYIGLLGNANGDPADDLRTRSGKVIPTKENSTYGLVSQALSNLLPVPAPLSQAEKIFFDIVYKEFGDSWRISQAESLFDYPPGKDTGTFTNRSFPNSYLSLNSLLPPQIRKAEEICRQAGVESELMDGCIFDVANTGDASFAESAANALLDTAKDRLLQQLRNKIPSLPVRIPGLPF